MQPLGVFFKGCEEVGEPAVLVAVGVSAWPDAKLFHVVAHGGHSAGMNAGGIPQIRNNVLDFAKWNEIAQRLLPGVQPHAFAAVFGDVRPEEFFGFESSRKEVHVVNKRVGDAGGSKCGWKLRLPNALRQPRSRRAPPKMFFEISCESCDLLELILGQDGDEYRLVEAAADQFDLCALDQFFQTRKIFGPMLLDPPQKRPGIMKTETNAGIFFKVLQEGKVGILIRLLKNAFEITAGLVSVNEQG